VQRNGVRGRHFTPIPASSCAAIMISGRDAAGEAGVHPARAGVKQAGGAPGRPASAG
jgi:hypothetical protein